MHPAQVAVIQWLNDVVIGLNLCPFSGKPTRENRVRFFTSEATDEESLLQDLQHELELLDTRPVAELETTLIIVPDLLPDFFDYTQFLQWANQLLKRMNWQGVYQIASFHPDYCFAGAEPDDAENLTNRAPYPILHIIREASLTKALEYFPDVEAIPDSNRECVTSLSDAERRQLFPYLFHD
ncbi:DUF1415 domain-containing protein [Cellvibrio sp. PSBB006]|uniref:DUF1415 domain-containing protein n=1 Tax=Cellvibrio sp. PSBB006 TaxID=1987723 RepID=UPI000B3B3B58|nr:DUF1415 domain-containing protein [Cellvibrio sp. PSBB006]ARU29635.1 hypothetical protein CBR65_20550 [Cellvibrio sp. PSBB006]